MLIYFFSFPFSFLSGGVFAVAFLPRSVGVNLELTGWG